VFDFVLISRQGLTRTKLLLSRVVFSDEATFHLFRHINRHKLRIWGPENPNTFAEHVRDSPKINVFCAISASKIYGPFLFAEQTVTGITYLDMLENWLMPQLLEVFGQTLIF
jgi:hypothetical protein